MANRKYIGMAGIRELMKLAKNAFDTKLGKDEIQEIADEKVEEVFSETASIWPSGNLTVNGDLEVGGNITNKGIPVSLEGHDHDDRYYTREQADSIFDDIKNARDIDVTSENGFGNMRVQDGILQIKVGATWVDVSSSGNTSDIN